MTVYARTPVFPEATLKARNSPLTKLQTRQFGLLRPYFARPRIRRSGTKVSSHLRDETLATAIRRKREP
jgi:hypothetical protein